MAFLTLSARFVLAIALCTLTYYSIKPASGTAPVMHFDKILHAVSYAVIAGFLAFAAPRLKLSWVFILPVIYGGLMELAQALSPYGRTGSIFDFLANAIGASVLVGTWCLFIGVVGRTRKTT